MNVAIVYKDTPDGKTAIQKALEIFRVYRVNAFVIEPKRLRSCETQNTCKGEGLEDLNFVLVLGGDGTLLAASRVFSRIGVPLLGVNIGGLGFITSVPYSWMSKLIEDIMNGDYTTENRTMISCKILGSERGEEYHALNDVVIHKGGALARIIDLIVLVDREELTTFRADGLIISTPTGSTAYNLSAGGPIVNPSLHTFIITPICPFTLTNRPIIVADESVIEIQMLKDREESVTLTIDGQVGLDFRYGESVILSKSKYYTKLIRPKDYSFYRVLKHKLGWGGRTLGDEGKGKC